MSDTSAAREIPSIVQKVLDGTVDLSRWEATDEEIISFMRNSNLAGAVVEVEAKIALAKQQEFIDSIVPQSSANGEPLPTVVLPGQKGDDATP